MDILEQLLRIGKKAIVSIPNLVIEGVILPGTKWTNAYDSITASQGYNTENIHLCTINDFEFM